MANNDRMDRNYSQGGGFNPPRINNQNVNPGGAGAQYGEAGNDGGGGNNRNYQANQRDGRGYQGNNRDGRGYEGNNRDGRGYEGNNRDGKYDQTESMGGLPQGYLEGGYFRLGGSDGKTKILKKELVLGQAESISKNIAGSRPEMGKSQLRKFYDQCKNISERLRLLGGDFDLVETDIFKLIIFVEDAKNKGKIPDIFYWFIRKNVESIKDADDFKKGFVEHFQAIVGYYNSKKN